MDTLSDVRIIGYKVIFDDKSSRKGIVNLDLTIAFGINPPNTTSEDCIAQIWKDEKSRGKTPDTIEYFIFGLDSDHKVKRYKPE